MIREAGETGGVSEGGGLTRQGTFSKENEREDSEGDTVPQARYGPPLLLATIKLELV